MITNNHSCLNKTNWTQKYWLNAPVLLRGSPYKFCFKYTFSLSFISCCRCSKLLFISAGMRYTNIWPYIKLFCMATSKLSKPQPNLNTRLGLTIIWLCKPHPTTTTQTQHQHYLGCYWPDFDETLQVGSWEHLEQILTFTVTFVQATFGLVTFVHISSISAVTDTILTKF